jgi:hypothetical protein
VQDFDQLTLNTEGATVGLDPDAKYSAKVQLRDGRQLKVPVSVSPPRPQVTLLSKGMQEDGNQPPSPVRMGSPDDLPLEGKLMFFLKSVVPQKFPRNQDVEVAAADGSFKTVLSLKDGSLILEDAKTALGMVEPLARFGSSAFGPVRARALAPNGVAGDWMDLGTLVRLPAFRELRCPRAVAKPCVLVGNNLYLAQSFAAAPDFESASDVPPNFTGGQLTVPHPVNGSLYLKLRDNPGTVHTLTLPISLLAASAQPPAPVTAQSQPAATPAETPAETPPATKPEQQK